MKRIIDFVRTLGYILALVTIYLGVGQVLVLTGWQEESQSRLIGALTTMYEQVWAGEGTTDWPEDQREEVIRRYLEARQSPLADFSREMVAVADKYDLPVYLMVAMAGAESNFGRSGYATDGTYNAVGLGIHEGRRYKSWAEGWEDFGFVLRNYYFDEGRDTPLAIEAKWAPRGVDSNGEDHSWADNVAFFLSEIEKMEV